MSEIFFEITQDADGGFSAECLTESIFTQGDNWEELRANVKEAVDAFYFDRAKPKPHPVAPDPGRSAGNRVDVLPFG